MLVGLDTTDKGWIGNSDSMILISVNYRLEQISMISLMRDTHVMIPGIGYRKLNTHVSQWWRTIACQDRRRELQD